MLGNHLLGIYEKPFDPQKTWRERLQAAQALGFDYMELSIDETDERLERLRWPSEKRRGLSYLSQELGMPLRSMCLSAHRRFPFGSEQRHIRDKARDVMESALELACQLGIRVIQLAGYDVYYEPSTPQSRARFAEGMHWAAKQAEKYQVMLGMEIMDTPFMNSITKHMTLQEQIQSPWFRLYPDIGNLSAWPENNVPSELRLGLKSMVACHLKDTIRVEEQQAGVFKGIPFGVGCVDFTSFFRMMKRGGYCGTYMIEQWYKPEEDEMSQVLKSKNYIMTQFQKAEEALCGT